MDATALLKEFCSAVERRDGKAFASLFTADGVYHDVFYGDFKGHQKIAETPARLRTRAGEAQKHREADTSPEGLRRRRSAANRVIS